MNIFCCKICHRFQTSIGKLSSLGLSDPAPTSAPSNNPVLGFHGWDETVPQGSVYLVSIYLFLPVLFFPNYIFFPSSVFFFFFGTVFYHIFFCSPLTPSLFLGSSYLPQPTYHLSSYQPTPHPPSFALTSITTASDLGRAWITHSFRSKKSTWASRARSFRIAQARAASTWWQQERKSKRSLKVVAEVGAWR